MGMITKLLSEGTIPYEKSAVYTVLASDDVTFIASDGDKACLDFCGLHGNMTITEATVCLVGVGCVAICDLLF